MMHESLMCHGRTMLYVVELMVICMGDNCRKKKKTVIRCLIAESKYQTNYIDLLPYHTE